MANFKSFEDVENIAEQKAKQLSESTGKKVFTYMGKVQDNEDGTSDWALGYLKEPARPIKMEALDRLRKDGELKAGDFLIAACLIREESDPRLLSDDSLYIGLAYASPKVIDIKADQSKKN